MRRIQFRAPVGLFVAAVAAFLLSLVVALPGPSATATPSLNNATACAPTAVFGIGTTNEVRTINLETLTTNSPTLSIQNPLGIAITTDGAKAIVPSFTSDQIQVIDIATNTSLSTSGVIAGPRAVAMSQDGRYAYVSSGLTGTAQKFDFLTNSFVGTPILVGMDPTGLSLALGGQTLVAVNYPAGTLTIVDLATETSTFVLVGNGPYGIAVTPDGKTALNTNQFEATVTVTDIASATVIDTVPVGLYPLGIAITPDGTTAVVANRVSNSVSTISIATGTTNPVDIPIQNAPTDVAITPDGRYAVTANESGTASVIDLASRSVIANIPVTDPGNDASIDITPCGLLTTSLTGRTLTVTGTQWGPTNPISLTMASTPTALGNVVSTVSGTFNASYEIACSVEAGQHTVTATSIGGLTASSVVTVPSCLVPPAIAG